MGGAARRTAEVSVPPVPTSPSVARRFVRDTLAQWGVDDGDDVVLLLASELVTNGVLHARTVTTLRLVLDPPDGVLLSVTDGSTRPLAERDYDVDAGTGRGLHLVSALATEWGVDHAPSGKTVWCRVSLEVSATRR